MKRILLLLITLNTFYASAQEHKFILGTNFRFAYSKQESYLGHTSPNVSIASNNQTGFLFAGFITPRLMIGAGVGLNTSKFLSDDGTNVFEESATGFNLFPDVRYYFPIKKVSLFLENKIYFGYSQRSSQIPGRQTRSIDNGIDLKGGIGMFLGKFYGEASINLVEFQKIKTSTPVDNFNERINQSTKFDMLQDFTTISLGVYYHFGKAKKAKTKKEEPTFD